VITDQAGNPHTENYTAGAGGVVINASGTVEFRAHDTYTGGTTIDAGTLELDSGGSIVGNAKVHANSAGLTQFKLDTPSKADRPRLFVNMRPRSRFVRRLMGAA